ncbi:Nif3-like dinuclear metal center hexameric protein [Candidatus Woesearchaeota archaeon]|nr:Nif3-like dinuclear metal center hexameric protein [Candidatus Woesearchaeota archaeon]
MATALEIAEFLDKELDINGIEDNSSNGLQVENTGKIKKIGFAVDACLETFQQAVEAGCQMLIVHHGLFWNKGKFYLNGISYNKIKFLMENNLALYAAHLPLDKHQTYGNNIQLAKLLGLENITAFGEHHETSIGFLGEKTTSLREVKKLLEKNKIQTLTLPFGKEKIRTVAIISGGAAGEVGEAIQKKADLYITGEPLHHVYHQAKEAGINVIFGGHYETEVWGVKALMPVLKDKFKIKVEFIDCWKKLMNIL